MNAGCPVTSIQKLLGHVRLNSTMRYARAHSQTVATDYFTAMAQIEQRLQLGPAADEPVDAGERVQLLEIAQQLNVSDLANDLRLGLVAQLLQVLAQRGLDPGDGDATRAQAAVSEPGVSSSQRRQARR